MSTSKVKEAKAKDVWFDSQKMHVLLLDGREISIPLVWFDKLSSATKTQRANWRLIGKGVGIHWPDLDEDLSVPDLLR
jgi:hypothetical protein